MKTFILSGLLALFVLGGTTASAQTGYFGPYFTHTASTANNDGYDGTLLNNAAINSDSSKTCIFTSVYGVYTSYNLGIYYYSPYWDIYQEDGDTIPNGASFNVLSPTSHGTSFIDTATPASIISNYTEIDNPAINGNPNALLFFSHIYNPLNAGTGYNYCDRTLGLWYKGPHWTIYNDDDNGAFLPNTTFNVFAVDSTNANAFVHVATQANTTTYITYIDNPFLNGNPNATIFVSYNLGAAGTYTYNKSPIGVWYDGSEWTIFNEITTDTIAYGSAFNVLIADDIPTGITATTSNDYRLSIYPNPSSSSSNLKYELKTSALVEIKLMNNQGQQVASIYSGKQNAGTYFVPVDLSSLAAGVYFCKFSADGNVLTKSLVKQ